MPRIDGGKNLGMPDQGDGAETADGDEPQQHDGPEDRTDACGPERLQREQPDQDADRDRHDQVVQRRRRHLDPLDGAQHRDRGRQDTVTVKQRAAEQAATEQDGGRHATSAAGAAAGHQGCQRQDAALAVMVGPHHEDAVFERNDEQQRPDDQRQDTQHGVGRDVAAGCLKDGLHRVERTGAEVAVDDAERREHRQRQGRTGLLDQLHHLGSAPVASGVQVSASGSGA